MAGILARGRTLDLPPARESYRPLGHTTCAWVAKNAFIQSSVRKNDRFIYRASRQLGKKVQTIKKRKRQKIEEKKAKGSMNLIGHRLSQPHADRHIRKSSNPRAPACQWGWHTTRPYYLCLSRQNALLQSTAGKNTQVPTNYYGGNKMRIKGGNRRL
jgi:hypothetical protein